MMKNVFGVDNYFIFFYCILMRYVALCISLSISSLIADSAGSDVNILAIGVVLSFNCVAKLCRNVSMDCVDVGGVDVVDVVDVYSCIFFRSFCCCILMMISMIVSMCSLIFLYSFPDILCA